MAFIVGVGIVSFNPIRPEAVRLGRHLKVLEPCWKNFKFVFNATPLKFTWAVKTGILGKVFIPKEQTLFIAKVLDGKKANGSDNQHNDNNENRAKSFLH